MLPKVSRRQRSFLVVLGAGLLVSIFYQNCGQPVHFDGTDLNETSVQLPQIIDPAEVIHDEIENLSEQASSEAVDYKCYENLPVADASQGNTKSGSQASIFQNVSNVMGQTWVDSNVITFTGLEGVTEVVLSALSANRAYTLNGVRKNLTYKDECRGLDFGNGLYIDRFKVRNGDKLQIHLVQPMYGNREEFMFVFFQGRKGTWTVKARDYRLDGGKNAKPSQVYTKCLGNEIMRVKNGGVQLQVINQTIQSIPTYVLSGGCNVLAQKSPIIKCIEVPNSPNLSATPNIAGDCVMYDGLPDKSSSRQTSTSVINAIDFSGQ